MGSTRHTRRARAVLGVLAVAVAITGVAAVVIHLGARGTAVTPAQALAHFRHDQHRRPASLPSAADTSTVTAASPATTTTPGASAAGHSSTPPGPIDASHTAAPSVGTPSRSAPPAQPLPKRGVYVYDTSGYEQVAVPGSRRDFPHHTTITVEDGGCGTVETWQPFDQHTEKTTVCPGSRGPRLASYYFSVSFYGQTDTQTLTCGPDAYLDIAGATPGRTWTYTCTSGQTTASNRARFVGYQTLTINGTPVRTLHVHVDTTTTGPNGGGSSPADYWFATTNSLLVRNTGTVDSNGGAHYSETYDLELTNLQPRT